MNPRIRKVAPGDDYKLKLFFTNGEKGVYDCSYLLDFGVFRELKNKSYFRQVKVLHGTIVWPHEQDICPDTLYIDSKKQLAESALKLEEVWRKELNPDYDEVGVFRVAVKNPEKET